MKTKKALKRLDKVESLLSSIIDQCDTKQEASLREALASAKESVVRAKRTVDHHQAKSNTVRKPPTKATAASQGAAVAHGRSRVRPAAAGE